MGMRMSFKKEPPPHVQIHARGSIRDERAGETALASPMQTALALTRQCGLVGKHMTPPLRHCEECHVPLSIVWCTVCDHVLCPSCGSTFAVKKKYVKKQEDGQQPPAKAGGLKEENANSD
jgi:hypothetical protein